METDTAKKPKKKKKVSLNPVRCLQCCIQNNIDGTYAAGRVTSDNYKVTEEKESLFCARNRSINFLRRYNYFNLSILSHKSMK